MSYKVVRFFTDLKDNNHAYNPGDKFPRDGKEVSEERIKELSSVNNLQHKVLIEEEVSEGEAETVKESKKSPKKRSK